jgi:tetratricopeptide (TPR) repeat protein
MTHTESHDLLLDLAYGELPAHVAAEVSQHLEGCAECQAESAQLDGVRKAFSPIRELEEPSHGFDDRVLAAARAEALLEHDGNIGQVIEGAGSFAAPSLAAASVDAHAAPVAAPSERRRPKWMMRAVLGGSAATAAALALVVGISQPKHPAARTSEEYAIHVAPAAAPAPEAPPPQARLDARAAAPKDIAPLQYEPGAAVGGSFAQATDAAQRAKGQAVRRIELKKKSRAVEEGSGSDVPTPQQLALRDAAKQEPASAGAGLVAPAAAPPPPTEKELEAQNVVVTGSSVRRRESDGAGSNTLAASNVEQSDAAAGEAASAAEIPQAAPASPAKMAAAARVSKAAVPTPEDPADLEHRAEAARHEGNYALAAGLYREAATEHHYNSSAGAWDLAHAVECLAAGGSFEEARRVRDQLGRLYPTEITAFAAARRAMREVDANPSK